MPFYFANKGNIHLNKILPQLFPLWAFELFFAENLHASCKDVKNKQ